MLEHLARRLSHALDRFLLRRAKARWSPDPGKDCDGSCSYCGYMCHACGRP